MQATIDCCDDEEEEIDYELPVEEIIIAAMKKFFSGLDWAAGGPIPNSELIKPEFISLFGTYPLTHAVSVGYRAIRLTGNAGQKLSTHGEIDEDTDVEIMLKVLNRCHKLRIPRGCIGGMFILYLHLCEGIRLY